MGDLTSDSATLIAIAAGAVMLSFLAAGFGRFLYGAVFLGKRSVGGGQ